jgi:hypothetical protein
MSLIVNFAIVCHQESALCAALKSAAKVIAQAGRPPSRVADDSEPETSVGFCDVSDQKAKLAAQSRQIVANTRIRCKKDQNRSRGQFLHLPLRPKQRQGALQSADIKKLFTHGRKAKSAVGVWAHSFYMKLK